MKKRLLVFLIGFGVVLLGGACLHAQTINTQLEFVSNNTTTGELIFDVQLISTTGSPTLTIYQHSITMSGRLDDAYTTHTLTPETGFSVNTDNKSGTYIEWQLTGSKIIGTSWTDVLRVSIEYTTEGSLGSITWGGGLAYGVAGATTGSPQAIPGSLTDFPLPVQVTQGEAIYRDGAVDFNFNLSGKCNNVFILRSKNLNGPYDQIAEVTGDKEGFRSYRDRNIEAGCTYHYQVKILEVDGSSRVYGPFSVECLKIPEEFDLIGNYPNPFNPATTIRYDLPEDALVQLKVYNILGNEVITLVNEEQKAGEQYEPWDGMDQNGNLVGSGVYFYKLVVGTEVNVGKMLKVE